MGQAAGKMQLVNPDTPEGETFYRDQVRQLLDVYPQIDCLVVWHRKNSTPWMEFSVESMPQAWQEEFASEVARTPDAKDLYHSHHLLSMLLCNRPYTILKKIYMYLILENALQTIVDY